MRARVPPLEGKTEGKYTPEACRRGARERGNSGGIRGEFGGIRIVLGAFGHLGSFNVMCFSVRGAIENPGK